MSELLTVEDLTVERYGIRTLSKTVVTLMTAGFIASYLGDQDNAAHYLEHAVEFHWVVTANTDSSRGQLLEEFANSARLAAQFVDRAANDTSLPPIYERCTEDVKAVIIDSLSVTSP